jgi:hypothetical protein
MSFRAALAARACPERQSDRDWSEPYTAERSDADTRFGIILNCAAHAYHHVGQIIYLQRELLHQAG